MFVHVRDVPRYFFDWRNGKWQFYIFYREGGRGEKKTVHRTRECFAVTNGLGCRACTVSMGRFEAFMEANSGEGLVRRQSIIFSCVRGIEILVCRCSAGSVFGRHAFDSLHCETADKPRFQSASRRRPLGRHGRSTNRFLPTSGTHHRLGCAACAPIPVGA